MTTSPSPTVSSLSSSNGASGSSLSPFRSFLRMLNWRRDPVREMRLKELEKRSKQLESEIEQLKRDNALLDWMHSEIDLIEADLPSNSTPPPTTAANSPRFQESCHPSHSYIRGLEDMTNASLQRGRQG